MKKEMKSVKMHKNFTKQHLGVSYKGRKATIFKMAKELATLSDVDVLLIMYDPHQHTPSVWCSKPNVETIIDKYLSKKKFESMTKKKNQTKILGKKTKQIPQNFPSERSNMSMQGGHGVGDQSIAKMGREDLKGLLGVLEGKLESINQRINHLRGGLGYVGANDSSEFMMMEYDGGDVGFVSDNQVHGSLGSVSNFTDGDDVGLNCGELMMMGYNTNGLDCVGFNSTSDQLHGSVRSDSDHISTTTSNIMTTDYCSHAWNSGDMGLKGSNQVLAGYPSLYEGDDVGLNYGGLGKLRSDQMLGGLDRSYHMHGGAGYDGMANVNVSNLMMIAENGCDNGGFEINSSDDFSVGDIDERFDCGYGGFRMDSPNGSHMGNLLTTLDDDNELLISYADD